MAKLFFTGNLQRHVDCPSAVLTGNNVAEILATYFSNNPQARGYVLDDQGAVRKHMLILVDGTPIQDRQKLSDPVQSASEVYIFQALSGG